MEKLIELLSGWIKETVPAGTESKNEKEEEGQRWRLNEKKSRV